MLTSTLLLPLVSLISTTSARALFTGSAYLLPSLTTSNSGNGTTTFAFTVYDSDPVTNVSTSCGSSWSGTNYPSQWTACQKSSFDWELSAFTDISNFELQVKHSFVDPRSVQPSHPLLSPCTHHEFRASRLLKKINTPKCRPTSPGRCNNIRKSNIHYAELDMH
jgi:hypothetical protein